MELKVRNIGISAHIDSGKTTLTERILFYTRRIHAMHDVKGKDGVGATMDSMELEKERGITIASAATYCRWKDCEINLIDTPGHVDFTIEVERSLRVLDGAVLVLCAVGGVQSQSITVDRQMKRYHIPCLAFINKCDRSGADPFRVVDQLRKRLGHHAVSAQMPMGLEEYFTGVIDFITMKAVYFDGEKGEQVRIEPIPEEYMDEAERGRDELLEAASMFSDELLEAIIEEKDISEDLVVKALRKGTLERKITVVFMGSAYKNKGVQPLLDAVVEYLPCPEEIENTADDLKGDKKPVILACDAALPLVALAFKLEDRPYGQLTYVRVYQGKLKKGDTVINMRNHNRIRVGRLARMHSDKMEEIDVIPAGYIGVLFGVDCTSGDTLAASGLYLTMTSMYVPEPVISLALFPKDKPSQINMTKALSRFTKEDPTFKTHVDEETREIIIQGMGELHLDVYVERMRREYNALIDTGPPCVAYRETITQKAEFDYLHKKQTGGQGQFARVIGHITPQADKEFEFENRVVGGRIPGRFITACEKGFKACLAKGSRMKFPITGIKVVLTDGASHTVDSSDMAFTAAAKSAFIDAYKRARPIILEPIMKVVVETPSEFHGAVLGLLNSRRGIIVATQEEGGVCVIEALVPLNEMFGYSTVLRSYTQGGAQFTMEFDGYKKTPQSVLDESAILSKKEK